jgi:CheY-like chemotaxis protein
MAADQQPLDQFRVLIVEDDENARTILSDYLRDLGLQVHVAENGMQGFIKAREIKPHAILLDIMMPRLDGFNVIEKIRTEIDTATPIIMTTALHRKEDVQKAMQAGANDYLVKPIDLRKLKSRLADHLKVDEESLDQGQNETALVYVMDGIVVLRLKGFPEYEAIRSHMTALVKELRNKEHAPARLIIDYSHADPDAIHDAMLDAIFAFSESVRVDLNNVLQVSNDHQLSARLAKHPIGKYFKRVTEFNHALEVLHR